MNVAARAQAPQVVLDAMALSRLTALRKPKGGVRGIATGMLRADVELGPRATVVSLDGRSAYDTISRATILAKLRDTVPSLLPVTCAMYVRTSTYLWWDDEGRVHEIAQASQAEGVEQGDPLGCPAASRRQLRACSQTHSRWVRRWDTLRGRKKV